MPYERGPFHLQQNAAVTIVPGVYDFGAGAIADLGPIDTLFADWDPLALAMAAETIFDSIDPLDGADIDGAAVELSQQANTAIFPDLDGILQAVFDAGALLDTAVNTAPIEAWTDPPAPFRTPVDVPIVPTPTVDQTAFVAGTGVPTGPPSPTITPGKALTLINLTRYGSPNFTVLDKWLVQATGTPDAVVNVHAYVDGNDIGAEDVGTIGSDSRFELSGTFGPSDVGAWREDWYIGDQFIVTYNFVVTST
jgi:hypothetical protein